MCRGLSSTIVSPATLIVWVRPMGKAREFLDFWMQNSIHAAEPFGMPGGSQLTSELKARCIQMAAIEGLSPADLEAEVGDLSEYIKVALVDANAKEQVRKNHN